MEEIIMKGIMMKVCNKCDFEFQEEILDDDGKPFIASHYCINYTWYSATDDCHYPDDLGRDYNGTRQN